MKIYQVGGSVRNNYIRKIHGIDHGQKDIDFAVETESFSSMREELISLGFVIHVESPQYLTIRCKVPEGHPARRWAKDADFTLCRTEGEYSDGRHPDEVAVGTIHTDLKRRDFTMNAIAIDVESGEVIDPFDGIVHIRSKIICSVGDPWERIIREDSLRALRAMRFMCTLDMALDIQFQSVFRVKELPELIRQLPVERVFQELNKMFYGNTAKSLDKFYSTTTPELRSAIFRDGLWLKATTEE